MHFVVVRMHSCGQRCRLYMIPIPGHFLLGPSLYQPFQFMITQIWTMAFHPLVKTEKVNLSSFVYGSFS